MTADEGMTNGGGLPRRYVRIPDMFSSIMSLAPRVNPHYQATKREAEKWTVSILRLDEQQAVQCSKADFTYVAGIWMPDTDEEALRVVTDWLHWVFFFDDQFDEGHLKAVIGLRRISSDLVCLQNDILSYRKDLALGVEHNIIHVYRKQGLSEQQAVDGVEEMFNSLYKGWYLALAEMPCWGEQTDREMLKYIDGCRDIALGNLCWSYTTGRYLGKEGA